MPMVQDLDVNKYLNASRWLSSLHNGACQQNEIYTVCDKSASFRNTVGDIVTVRARSSRQKSSHASCLMISVGPFPPAVLATMIEYCLLGRECKTDHCVPIT